MFQKQSHLQTTKKLGLKQGYSEKPKKKIGERCLGDKKVKKKELAGEKKFCLVL